MEHFYEIGYGDYDGSGDVQLMHEEQFSPEAFAALVYAVLPQCVAGVLDEPAIPGPTDMEGEPFWRHCSFADVYQEVAATLVSLHGFRYVEFTARFRVNGGGSLLDPTDHSEITVVLNAAGYTLETHPDLHHARKKAWDDLSPEWRASFVGYDAGSWADAWNDSIPEDQKRKPERRAPRPRPPRRRPRG